MGACSDETNEKYGVTREQSDEYAIESYKRSARAWERGFFKHEVEPIQGKKVLIEEDEEYKRVHFEKIPRLKPTFTPNGTVTSANASTINDGACALILMSMEKARAVGVKPLARFLSFADKERDTLHFGAGPSHVVDMALDRVDLKA